MFDQRTDINDSRPSSIRHLIGQPGVVDQITVRLTVPSRTTALSTRPSWSDLRGVARRRHRRSSPPRWEPTFTKSSASRSAPSPI